MLSRYISTVWVAGFSDVSGLNLDCDLQWHLDSRAMYETLLALLSFICFENTRCMCFRQERWRREERRWQQIDKPEEAGNDVVCSIQSNE